MNSRKEEILAKRAKLEAIKRQREARQKEFSTSRSALDLSDVSIDCFQTRLTVLAIIQLTVSLGGFYIITQTCIER